MPSISDKARLMPESPIRKLVPYSEEAKKKGRKVYHLNIGQPDIETPAVALRSIHNFSDKVIEYSHSAGFESYRKGLAGYYKKVGINVDYNQIIITTGGSEALLFGFMSCLNPGDEVIIPEPFYANYNGFSVASGVVVKAVVSDIKSGFALPPVEDFEKLITPKTKAILICNPGNPTGYLYSEQELKTLANIVKKHNLFLFSDEVYREFCYDGKKHFSVLNLDGIDDNVVLIDSVSKRYSMCGVRVGALVTKNKEVYNAVMKFAQARLSPPTLGQIASEAALSTSSEYFNNVVKEYTERRNIMVDGLNKIPGVYCPKPGGAFYAMAELPVDDADKFCQWLLESFEHKNQTIMFAPASGFYSNPLLGKKQVRIAYVLNKESLSASLECLDIALKQYNAKLNSLKKQEAV
jgi:aspartate aminotransferase